MYFDTKPCRVCGAEVRLEPRTTPTVGEPDATLDERVCTNPECETHGSGPDTPEP